MKKRLFATIVFAAALGLMLAMCARAAVTDTIKPDSVSQSIVAEGIVVPDTIYDRQPFSFAARQVVEGEVVSIQSVDGVVVERSKADKYGRMFLEAGLPSGAYLLSRSIGGQPLGRIEIQRRAADALERPGDHPPQPMQLRNLPQAVKLSDSFNLSGQGFSPNFADMQVNLSTHGKTEAAMVLAATEDQLKLAPVQQLPPGAAQLRVTNQATGQNTDAYELLLYDIQGNLVRRAIKSGGDQTRLIITTRPKNQPLNVKVSVASGPVDFGEGRKQAEAVTNNGQAIFPVHAERGSGPFQLTWELAPSLAHACDQDPEDLSDFTDAELVKRRQELNRQKDQDYRDHDGKPGPKSADLWCRIKKIEAELRDRGLTIDKEGNVHTPSYYKGTSLEPGHSYPPR